MGQDGTAVTTGPAAITMLKVGEIADILDVDKSTVYRHIAAGLLHAVRAGRSLRIPEPAFQAYLQPATPGPVSAVTGTRPGPGPTATPEKTGAGATVTAPAPATPVAVGA